MSFRSIQKILCLIATFALLANSLITPYSVFAQEELSTPTPTVEPTPVETPIETSTPSPEPTILPTTKPTLEPTPVETPIETSTPSAEPVSTETPVQTTENPVVSTNEPVVNSPAPTQKPIEVQKGDITTTVIENVNLNDIVLLNSNVDAPNVSTDKADYSPTSIVFITGTNFSKNSEYIIEISSTDEPPVTHTGTVITDQGGVFYYSYQLDGNYRPDYKIEVKDGKLLVASTTFTDSPTGATNGSSFSNVSFSGSDHSWSNPSNASSSNNSYSTTTITSSNNVSDYLRATGFNFAIPSGAVINGITVSIERSEGNLANANIRDNVVQLVKNNSLVGQDKGTNTNWPTTDTVATYGSASDLWGTTWTRDEINNSNFGVVLSVGRTSNGDEQAKVDYININVEYTVSDTTPPVISINNPTTTPAQSKTITASTNEGTLTMSNTTGSVCNNSLSFVAYSSQTFTNELDNGKKVCYKAVDSANNTAYLMSSAISGIDKTAPVITILSYPVTWTNQDIIVSASTNEGKLNANSHTFTANGTFTFTATDLAGNSSSQGVTIINIDKTLPTILANISSGTLGLNGWYKSAVTIHFSCADTDSGIANCPNDQILNSEGNSISSIDQTAIDNAYNVSALSNIITVKIDKTAPTATINYDVTTPTAENVIATLVPSENITITNNGGLTSYTFNNNESFTFEFIDQAGNTGTVVATVNNIDRTAPTITINPYNTGLTNQDITVSATVDEGSLNTNSHVFTENGSFDFIATDLAGNLSTKTVTVTNIDKVAPVLINQSFFGNSWYDGWMESVFSYWDENGISVGENQSCMITTEGPNQTCSLTPNVIDNAGNVNNTQVISNTANIDMSNPTGNWISPVANSTVSGIVDLNFEAEDAGSGVKSVEYSYKRNDGVDSFHIIPSNVWDTTDLELDTYTLRATVTDNVNKTISIDEVVGISAMISNENVVTLGTNSVGISWTTNKPTTSRVIYDTVSHGTPTNESPNYGYAFSTDTYNGDKVLNHYITISGLPSGSNFYYRTVSTGSPIVIGPEGYFRTYSTSGAPTPAEPSSIISTSVLGASTGTVKLAYQDTQDNNLNTTTEEKPETTNKEDKGAVLGQETKTESPVRWVLISTGILALILIISRLLRKNKQPVI